MKRGIGLDSSTGSEFWEKIAQYVTRRKSVYILVAGVCLSVGVSLNASSESSSASQAEGHSGTELPTGKTITPTAASGSLFQDLNPEPESELGLRANMATSIAVSPDGRLLAIATGGFNVFSDTNGKVSRQLSNQHIFLFDITQAQPKQLQVLSLPNSFQGLEWAPTSKQFFASGGTDDTVTEFVLDGSVFRTGRTFRLNHKRGLGVRVEPATDHGVSERVPPVAAGLAVSPDGTQLLVGNLQNDSVSLIEIATGRLFAEQDLRPGIIDYRHRGEPGGSFLRSLAWTSGHHAYVASERDREIISLAIDGAMIKVLRRTPVPGAPTAIISNRSGSRLYVALDTSSQVAIIDTVNGQIIETVDVAAPASVYRNDKMLGGANTNALVLTPDETTLLVSNGGLNSIAVVRLGTRARNTTPSRNQTSDDDDAEPMRRSATVGLVPTGWYPTGVATSQDGAHWYVVNGKSPSGPNMSWCRETQSPHTVCTSPKAVPGRRFAQNGVNTLLAENQFVHQLERAGFMTLPAPGATELARLTKQVAHNNHFDRPNVEADDQRLFSFLRDHIKHVIYILKENRSYDQVLGDLGVGNGDASFTLFPKHISPNHHAIARSFVTLDNLLVSGEVSWSGWDWTAAAQTTDFREHQEPLATRMLFMGDAGGMQADNIANRNVNVGIATNSERRKDFAPSPSDPDLLPGTRNIYSPDGPEGEEGKGFLWDAALKAGLTVRNYGYFGAVFGNGERIPLERHPFVNSIEVFRSGNPTLRNLSDPFYYDVDMAYPDFWRIQEWKREYQQFIANGDVPNLMMVVLPGDHFGQFNRAIDGVNTPEIQMADNDYALGSLIETVAQGPFAKDTLIVSIEDDACDGPDHVDSHRSIALFAGPYVRQHALVSTRYTTVSVVKTIEEILGVGPIGLNDALAAPMSDVFDTSTTTWSYKAIVPAILRSAKLPLPPDSAARIEYSKHSAGYWAKVMAGQDFSGPDRIEPASFNRELWRGLKSNVPYPATRTGDRPKD